VRHGPTLLRFSAVSAVRADSRLTLPMVGYEPQEVAEMTQKGLLSLERKAIKHVRMHMVFSLCLVTAALSAQPAQKPLEYPFKQIEVGGFSRQREAKVCVIKSPEEYQAYDKTCGRQAPTPHIDWKKTQILAIHIGPAPSTGYGVVVKRIVKTGSNSVDIEVVKTTPPPGMMQAMHVTYPFVLVATVRFKETPSVKVMPNSVSVR
jgi:hypothetical protein